MSEGKVNPAKNLRSYYHGMVVDRVMRTWLDDPRPGAMPGMVAEAIQTGIDDARNSGDGIVRWRNATDREDMEGFCTELVTRLEPILAALVLPYPFLAGHRFSVDVSMTHPDGTPTPVTLVGEMDLLVHRPDGWVVWDLKGTRDDQYWRKVLGQLVFYDLAVLAERGTRTVLAGLIQPMCTEPVLALEISEGQRRDLWGRLHRMATQMWTADTACKDTTSGCQWCEVRHACSRYDLGADTLGLSLRHLADTAKETP